MENDDGSLLAFVLYNMPQEMRATLLPQMEVIMGDFVAILDKDTATSSTPNFPTGYFTHYNRYTTKVNPHHLK